MISRSCPLFIRLWLKHGKALYWSSVDTLVFQGVMSERTLHDLMRLTWLHPMIEVTLP